jgi:hypothetical protein
LYTFSWFALVVVGHIDPNPAHTNTNTTNTLTQVRVADLLGSQLRGMLVMLDDIGRLTINYLGTDPMLNPVGFGEVGAAGPAVAGALPAVPLNKRGCISVMVHAYLHPLTCSGEQP